MGTYPNGGMNTGGFMIIIAFIAVATIYNRAYCRSCFRQLLKQLKAELLAQLQANEQGLTQANEQGLTQAKEQELLTDRQLAACVEMGFEATTASSALEATNGDKGKAIEILLRKSPALADEAKQQGLLTDRQLTACLKHVEWIATCVAMGLKAEMAFDELLSTNCNKEKAMENLLKQLPRLAQ